MINLLRLFTILLPLLLMIFYHEHRHLIPMIAATELILILSRFFYIRIAEFRKQSVTVGMHDFYMPALIMQLTASLIVSLLWYFDLHQSAAVAIHQSVWVISYVALLLLLESRKNLFFINRRYLLHSIGFRMTVWTLTEIRRINILSDRIEFVRGNTKLKAILGEKSSSSRKLSSFLHTHAGNKLRGTDKAHSHQHAPNANA